MDGEKNLVDRQMRTLEHGAGYSGEQQKILLSPLLGEQPHDLVVARPHTQDTHSRLLGKT